MLSFARNGQAWRGQQPARRARRRRRLRLLRQSQPILLRLQAACLVRPGRPARALALTSPKVGERDVALGLLARVQRVGHVVVIGDKGYAGKDFEADAGAINATIVRPHRKDEPGQGPHLTPIRQRIESIFWTAKDIFTLQRHGARTLHALRTRLVCRFAAM
jgi:hypothetical protein